MKNEASVRICIGWLWAWKRGEKTLQNNHDKNLLRRFVHFFKRSLWQICH